MDVLRAFLPILPAVLWIAFMLFALWKHDTKRPFWVIVGLLVVFGFATFMAEG